MLCAVSASLFLSASTIFLSSFISIFSFAFNLPANSSSGTTEWWCLQCPNCCHCHRLSACLLACCLTRLPPYSHAYLSLAEVETLPKNVEIISFPSVFYNLSTFASLAPPILLHCQSYIQSHLCSFRFSFCRFFAQHCFWRFFFRLFFAYFYF